MKQASLVKKNHVTCKKKFDITGELKDKIIGMMSNQSPSWISEIEGVEGVGSVLSASAQ